MYEAPTISARNHTFNAEDPSIRADPRYKASLSWNRAAAVSHDSHYTPINAAAMDDRLVFSEVGSGRTFNKHQRYSDIKSVPMISSLSPTHPRPADFNRQELFNNNGTGTDTPTKSFSHSLSERAQSGHHQRYRSPTKIEGFSVDHRSAIDSSPIPNMRPYVPVSDGDYSNFHNSAARQGQRNLDQSQASASKSLHINQELDETLYKAHFDKIPAPFGSEFAKSLFDSVGVAIITSLMESQGVDPRENPDMVKYHAAPEFTADLERAVKGEYLTRYHLLRNCDKTGPDPIERFISLQIEQPPEAIRLRTKRKNPFVYLNVRAVGSPAAETISRSSLSDLVGVTRDVCNPAFGPHRIFIDGSIGYNGVAYESIPVCPDPDASTKEYHIEYKQRQLRLLQAYKEKVVGMRGQRFAATGKHRLLHADNAFTLWFYNISTMQASQVVLCANSQTSADFWVTVFKGILSVNSGRVVPIPTPTVFNDGGRIGKAGARLLEYKRANHQGGGGLGDDSAVGGGGGDPLASRSPSVSRQSQPKLSQVNSGANFGRTSSLASFFVVGNETTAEKERKIAAQIKKNDKQMKREYFLPRPVGVNAEGETIGEDGLTEKERELMQLQRPALPYLFRKARHLIDLRNAQTQYFEVK